MEICEIVDNQWLQKISRDKLININKQNGCKQLNKEALLYLNRFSFHLTVTQLEHIQLYLGFVPVLFPKSE